jgi:hypothetical protein
VHQTPLDLPCAVGRLVERGEHLWSRMEGRKGVLVSAVSVMNLISASSCAWIPVIIAVAIRGRLARSWHSTRVLFNAATNGTMSS